jgi:hypothetical protein
MDRSNDRQQVRSALEEGDEMVRKQNADRRDLELDIKLQRVDAEINRRGERKEYDRYLSLQRVELDKAVETSHSELAKKVRTELLALLNKALTHQRATYDQKIEQERALSNDALQKVMSKFVHCCAYYSFILVNRYSIIFLLSWFGRVPLFVQLLEVGFFLLLD